MKEWVDSDDCGSSSFLYSREVSGPAEPDPETDAHTGLTDGEHLFSALTERSFLTSGVAMTQEPISASSSEKHWGRNKKQAEKKLLLQAFQRGSYLHGP